MAVFTTLPMALRGNSITTFSNLGTLYGDMRSLHQRRIDSSSIHSFSRTTIAAATACWSCHWYKESWLGVTRLRLEARWALPIERLQTKKVARQVCRKFLSAFRSVFAEPAPLMAGNRQLRTPIQMPLPNCLVEHIHHPLAKFPIGRSQILIQLSKASRHDFVLNPRSNQSKQRQHIPMTSATHQI